MRREWCLPSIFRHGRLLTFRHSRRQYCAKLKEWNLRKNLLASDKDKIIDKIVAARLLGQTITEVRQENRPVDLKSLLKHAQSKLRSLYIDSSIAEEMRELHGTLARQDSKITSVADTSADEIQIIYQDFDNLELGSLELNPDENEWTVITSLDTIPPRHELGTNEQGVDMPHIQPALAYAPTFGLERIIKLSHDYILAALESRMRNTLAQPHEAQLLPWFPDTESSAMRAFWVDTKNALYMAKKRETGMTFSFASSACAAIQAPTNVETSIGTLKDVLATLSLTNANPCLQLRDHLLHYLSEILGLRYGTQHPLVLLCSELRQQTTDPQIYETALRSAMQFIGTKQGTQSPDTLSFRRELIRLLRRSQNLCQAEELCVEQEAYYVQQSGSNALVTRRATSDLVHILMAKKDLVRAMAICEDLLERSRQHLAKDFPDELAVYALEDLAELCELGGSSGRSLFLVHEAYFGAVRLWGAEASSTKCIFAKIQAASQLQQDVSPPTMCQQSFGMEL